MRSACSITLPVSRGTRISITKAVAIAFLRLLSGVEYNINTGRCRVFARVIEPFSPAVQAVRDEDGNIRTFPSLDAAIEAAEVDPLLETLCYQIVCLDEL